ncbi:MAG TPA: MBL fold metallo-hydrolase [Thermoanaerobaculia bacterium]|nr:MBL fold metallo-hydrolase [Thermoanaerobaculia bacterium]
MRRVVLALRLLVLLAALPVAAQQDFSKVAITVTPLTGGLAMLQGSGGNLAVAHGEDGVFLVDDQYAPLTDKIRAAVATLSAKPIRFVLNTHWHGDHTGGNENLGRAGTLIVAHDNVRVQMAVEHFSQVFNIAIPASPAVALPVVTFNDTVTFHLNGETIHAYHVPPAHTDGDSVVWFKKADVVHLGDLFFNGLYPFIDGESGGSIDGVIAAANRVLGELGPATRIIPGHGPLAGKAELAAYRDMLVGVRANVAALVAAGKSLDETLAAKPTAAWDEAWGKGFLSPDTFTRHVYAMLAKKS